MLSSYPNPAHQHHAAGTTGPAAGGGHHGQLPQQQSRSLGGTPSMSFQQRQQAGGGEDQNQLTEKGDQSPLKLLTGINKVEDRSPTNNNINDRSDSNISDSADYDDDEELDGDCRSRSTGVTASAAAVDVDPEPESLVVGSRRDVNGEQTTGLKRRERDDEAESAEGDDVDGERDEDGESVGAERPPAAKSRRLHDDQARPHQLDLMRDGTDDIRGDGGIDGRSSSSEAGSLSDGSRSPYDLHRVDGGGARHHQTEIIKSQRPLGLLAQHRIQTSASSMFRPGAGSALRTTPITTTPTTDALSIGGAGLRLEEQAAMAAEQQRRFAELFCRPPHHFDERALGSMINYGVCPPTSLPPTPTSAGVVGLDYSLQASRFDSLMDRRFIPSPPLSTSPCSGHDEPASPVDASTGGHHRHWTFQEQFKQLYEMSDDQKRKEFLDELFTFMQKRGTPVNRIPIMAKQTLDLYELFRLVVSKGGLVEVINKKLWREITKGLNLPSSITSAAFTLRTQYMKYLYPFECEKLKLSTLAELQYAVDGNRREGRRPSYGGGPDFSPMSTPSLQSHPQPPGTPTVSHHMQQQQQQQSGLMSALGPTTPQQFADGLNAAALAAAAAVAARTNGLAFVTPRDAAERLTLAAQHQSLPTVNQLRTLAECDSRAMEAAARAMQEAMVKRIEEASSRAAAAAAAAVSAASTVAAGRGMSGSQPPPLSQQQMKVEDGSSSSQQSLTQSQSKRPIDDLGGGSFTQPPGPPPAHVLLGRGGVGAAHIKLTSRNDGRSEFDSSIVASMEVNGIVYQGVLFAQNPHLLGRI